MTGKQSDAITNTSTVAAAGFINGAQSVNFSDVPFFSPGASEIAPILFGVKYPCSVRVKRQLAESNPRLLARLTIRERPGKFVFRFWQEGPGYDRNLFRDDSVLRSIEYIHNNPVRKGLCATPAEWLWSSWNHYQQPAPALDSRLPNDHRFVG